MTTKEAAPRYGFRSETTAEDFEELRNALLHLHAYWRIYLTLFTTKEATDTLSASAGTFFRLFYNSLYDELVMRISRLNDTAEQTRRGKRHKNLTFETLVDDIEADDPGPSSQEMRRVLGRLRKHAEPFKTHRNKVVSHSDYDVARKISRNPLPPLSRKLLADHLRRMRDFVDMIGNHYQALVIVYEPHFLHGGPDVLLKVLKRGVEASREARQKPRLAA